MSGQINEESLQARLEKLKIDFPEIFTEGKINTVSMKIKISIEKRIDKKMRAVIGLQR